LAHDPEDSLEDVSADDLVEMNKQVKDVSMETVHQMFSLLFEIESTIRFSTQPRIALEAILIKLSQAHRVSNVDQIIGRLDSLSQVLEEKGSSPENRYPTPRRQREETGSETAEAVKAKPYGSLRETWQDLLSAFGRQSKPLVPCLEKAELMKIGEDFLEITVQENSFFTSRLKDERTLDTMREVCRNFFKRDMQIRLLEKAEQDSEPVTRENGSKGNQLKRDALNHPVVTDALEVFNGKVVDVKIL
jgi:DNA polymerase-3 subunit gamma/tau